MKPLQRHVLIDLIGLGHRPIPGSLVRHERFTGSLGLVLARDQPQLDKPTVVTVLWSVPPAFGVPR